jgi:hypothetical protein
MIMSRYFDSISHHYLTYSSRLFFMFSILFGIVAWQMIEIFVRHTLELRARRVMPYKQIFINLDRSALEEIKEKAAKIEKRTLNSLSRKLISQLPRDRVKLLELAEILRNEGSESAASKDSVGLTIRIEEEELWDFKEQALKARTHPREIIVGLLELWNRGKLDSILQELEEGDAVRRAS